MRIAGRAAIDSGGPAGLRSHGLRSRGARPEPRNGESGERPVGRARCPADTRRGAGARSGHFAGVPGMHVHASCAGARGRRRGRRRRPVAPSPSRWPSPSPAPVAVAPSPVDGQMVTGGQLGTLLGRNPAPPRSATLSTAVPASESGGFGCDSVPNVPAVRVWPEMGRRARAWRRRRGAGLGARPTAPRGRAGGQAGEAARGRLGRRVGRPWPGARTPGAATARASVRIAARNPAGSWWP